MTQSEPGAGVVASSTASAPTDSNAQAPVSADPGWKYCTVPDKAKKHELKCNFCGLVYKGGITRIKLHLAHIPKCNVAKCGKVPTDVKKEKGKNANKVVKSETFWKNVDRAVNFFEPLANVLRMMDSDVPAMGFLYGCLLDAKKDIAKKFDNDESQYSAVWGFIDKRWDSKLKSPLHLAGYYLNPYYYYPNKLEIELDGIFREGLVTCVTKMVEDEEIQDKIMEELNMYQDEMGSFGKDIATRHRKNEKFDPCKWWLNHGTSSPNLRSLAIRILGLTCSSSACERNWSDFEQVHSKRRNRLLHDKMRDLVFVKFNPRLKHKRENKARDPIVKEVVDILEDGDNEFITGVAANDEDEPKVPQGEGEKEQEQGGVAAAQNSKRKRVLRATTSKRVRKITDIADGKKSAPEIVAASSSDSDTDEHEADMDTQSTSHQSSQSESENYISE